MRLPFDTHQFFSVFVRYNTAVWPAQVALTLAALCAVALALWPRRGSDRTIAVILGVLWLWMGVVYHLVFFRSINPAAVVFGILFILEGVLLIVFGGWLGRLRFAWTPTISGLLGAALISYALLVYPTLTLVLGHQYPAAPTFGLPCPTTIVTLGLLALTSSRPPLSVLAIPLLWSAVGVSAAVQLGIWEDLGLVAAGGLTFLSLLTQVPPRRDTPFRP
ncbi:MAG TPA: DUF6064 family protein [Gemmatimonadales bacterium]|nr:DUF6064 family protein [Gemmatimonadales bacterium]